MVSGQWKVWICGESNQTKQGHYKKFIKTKLTIENHKKYKWGTIIVWDNMILLIIQYRLPDKKGNVSTIKLNTGAVIDWKVIRKTMWTLNKYYQ